MDLVPDILTVGGTVKVVDRLVASDRRTVVVPVSADWMEACVTVDDLLGQLRRVVKQRVSLTRTCLTITCTTSPCAWVRDSEKRCSTFDRDNTVTRVIYPWLNTKTGADAPNFCRNRLAAYHNERLGTTTIANL